jgi:methionine--tRNA ligase beta chain
VSSQSNGRKPEDLQVGGVLQDPLVFCYGGGNSYLPRIDRITIDDLRNIELRVATIQHAEPHPNADRLMVVKIDLVSEERQLGAGIRGHYTPEELIGKQVVVVANL